MFCAKGSFTGNTPIDSRRVMVGVSIFWNSDWQPMPGCGSLGHVWATVLAVSLLTGENNKHNNNNYKQKSRHVAMSNTGGPCWPQLVSQLWVVDDWSGWIVMSHVVMSHVVKSHIDGGLVLGRWRCRKAKILSFTWSC